MLRKNSIRITIKYNFFLLRSLTRYIIHFHVSIQKMALYQYSIPSVEFAADYFS